MPAEDISEEIFRIKASRERVIRGNCGVTKPAKRVVTRLQLREIWRFKEANDGVRLELEVAVDTGLVGRPARMRVAAVREWTDFKGPAF